MKRPISVYVELDCLLDTRLGILRQYYPNQVHEIVMDDYHNRNCDIFKGVDQQQFIELYKKRDIGILDKSTVTPCFALVNKVLYTMLKDLPDDPEFESVSLTVNTFPYYLDEDGLDKILAAVRKWVDFKVDVHFIYTTPRALTPSEVKAKYIALIMYDFNTWTEMHHASFGIAAEINEVTVLSPRIYPARPPTDDEIEELKNSGLVKPKDGEYEVIQEVFELYEQLAMPFYNLILVPVEYFSIIKPDFKDLFNYDGLLTGRVNKK